MFCRFAGCNLWSGLERDRDDAICKFCDTDFVGTDGEGGESLVLLLILLPQSRVNGHQELILGIPYVVFTGGEPLLQLDRQLIDEMHMRGFEIAVETNGTIGATKLIGFVLAQVKCPSKVEKWAGVEIGLSSRRDAERFSGLQLEHFFAANGWPSRDKNTDAAIEYCW